MPNIVGHCRASSSIRPYQIRIEVLVGLREIEHELVGSWFAKRKGDVGAIDGAFVFCFGPERSFQRLGKTIERPGPNGGQNVIFVFEVAVGRHSTDAELCCELAHSEAFWSASIEHSGRGDTQPFPEISYV